MIKYIALLILLLSHGCTSVSTLDLNFTIQILEKKPFLYTIESSKSGSSLKWIRKYDRDFNFMKEFEMNGYYGKIAKIEGDTIFFQIYATESNFMSPTSNNDAIVWGNEYIKFEKINVRGFMTDRVLSVNDFEISNDTLVFETSNLGKYTLSIVDIKSDGNNFYTQNYSKNILISTKIEFNEIGLKDKLISTLLKYWQKKMNYR